MPGEATVGAERQAAPIFPKKEAGGTRRTGVQERECALRGDIGRRDREPHADAADRDRRRGPILFVTFLF